MDRRVRAIERDFCTNFKCCAIQLPDLHALFEHRERCHPDGHIEIDSVSTYDYPAAAARPPSRAISNADSDSSFLSTPSLSSIASSSGSFSSESSFSSVESELIEEFDRPPTFDSDAVYDHYDSPHVDHAAVWPTWPPAYPYAVYYEHVATPLEPEHPISSSSSSFSSCPIPIMSTIPIPIAVPVPNHIVPNTQSPNHDQPDAQPSPINIVPNLPTSHDSSAQPGAIPVVSNLPPSPSRTPSRNLSALVSNLRSRFASVSASCTRLGLEVGSSGGEESSTSSLESPSAPETVVVEEEVNTVAVEENKEMETKVTETADEMLQDDIHDGQMAENAARMDEDDAPKEVFELEVDSLEAGDVEPQVEFEDVADVDAPGMEDDESMVTSESEEEEEEVEEPSNVEVSLTSEGSLRCPNTTCIKAYQTTAGLRYHLMRSYCVNKKGKRCSKATQAAARVEIKGFVQRATVAQAQDQARRENERKAKAEASRLAKEGAQGQADNEAEGALPPTPTPPIASSSRSHLKPRRRTPTRQSVRLASLNQDSNASTLGSAR